MKLISLFIIQLCFLSSLYAGDRGCRIGVVDISIGEPTKASARLFELLKMDAKRIYTKNTHNPFGWSTDGSEVLTLKSKALKGLFKPMILNLDKQALSKVIEGKSLSEGLIVFEYDQKSLHVRFKLFDRDGNELALIKLPVERNGAMKHSVLKHIREAALSVLGSSVRFSP